MAQHTLTVTVDFAKNTAIGEGQPVVRFFINRVELIDLVRPLEAEYEPKRAGKYIGPFADTVFLPSRRLLGTPEGEMAKTELLQCSCGVEGCWGLLAKIATDAHTIVWSDFEHSERTP